MILRVLRLEFKHLDDGGQALDFDGRLLPLRVERVLDLEQLLVRALPQLLFALVLKKMERWLE